MTRSADHPRARTLQRALMSIAVIAMSLAFVAPAAGAASLFDVAPNDRDAYVKVDFVKLAGAPTPRTCSASWRRA